MIFFPGTSGNGFAARLVFREARANRAAKGPIVIKCTAWICTALFVGGVLRTGLGAVFPGFIEETPTGVAGLGIHEIIALYCVSAGRIGCDTASADICTFFS